MLRRAAWLLAATAAATPAKEATPASRRTPEERTAALIAKEKAWAATLSALPMREQVVRLKKAYRGVAQRPQNLAAAAVVLGSVPAELDGWLDEDKASSLLNGLGFFELEIPQQPQLIEWAWAHIAGFQNSSALVLAAQGLLQLDPDTDEAADRLRRDVVPLLRARLPELHGASFHGAVKLFQRLQLDDPAVWDEVCAGIRAREAKITARPSDAVRLFAALARCAPEHELTAELFEFLVPSMGDLRSYDFTAMISGVERWGRAPFGSLLTVLARLGERTSFFNARDLGVSFPACVRATLALERKGGLSTAEELELAQHLHYVFDMCEAQVERVMNPQLPSFYWRKPTDVMHVLYAYESSGRCPPRIFDRFAAYCDAFAEALGPRDVALALGMLRRTGRLTADFALKVLPVLEAHPGELTFEEASHVALALATLPGDAAHRAAAAMRQEVAAAWDDATAERCGHSDDARHIAAANFAAALRGKDDVEAGLDASRLSARQLTDLLKSSMTSFVDTVRAELASRLEKGNLTPREVVALAAAAGTDATLRRPLQAALGGLLDARQWSPAALEALRYSTKLDKARYAAKAVAMAKDLAVSPQHFVAVANVLADSLPAEPAVVGFLRDSAQELARGPALPGISFLAVALRCDGVVDLAWFTAVMDAAAAKPKLLRGTDIASLAEFAPIVAWDPEAGATAFAALVARCVELAAEDALGAEAALTALTSLCADKIPAEAAAAIRNAVTARRAAETAASAESATEHKKERAAKREKKEKEKPKAKKPKAEKEKKPAEKKPAEKKAADKKKASDAKKKK